MRVGYGMKQRRRRSIKAAPLLIAPSAGWNGTAGSGFSTVPADPVRTTAKPVLRLIVPPFQWYTNELVVGVYAAANNGGSLFDNMGISQVIAHYEGSRVFIERPTVEVITDANGNQRPYFGWWLRLRNDGRSGHARLYFEAVPKDATMQRRVIGPFQFSPQPTLYSHDVTVAASLPQVVGSRYPTVLAACNYLKSVNATNPRITITEAGSYVLDGVTNGWASGSWINGYVHVEATAPATLVRPAPAANADPTAFRPFCCLHLKGSNLTLDFANATELWNSDTAGRDHWLDGIKITSSKGRYALYRKTLQSSLGWLMRQTASYQGAFVTECNITYLPNALINTTLARGNTIKSTWSDLFTHCQCVIGNTVDDHDSTEYMTKLNALSVSYSGTGTTATLERSGNVLTARVNGASVGTFTLDASLAGFNAGTNYNVANVVAWLNGLSGWSATLLNDSRAANFLAIPGSIPGNFAAQNVKNTTLTLQTWFDVHADWWQRQNTPTMMENVVLVDNVATNFVGAAVFWGQMDDGIMANNVWHHKEGIGVGGIDTGLAASRSQLGGTQRHVMHVHNANTGQRLWWRTDSSGLFNPDAYSVFANNVFPSFEWFTATDADLVPQDNHMFDGYTLPPTGTSGSTQGGSATTLFANPAAGDFAPRGALASNLKTARLPFDGRGTRRGPVGPVGAFA